MATNAKSDLKQTASVTVPAFTGTKQEPTQTVNATTAAEPSAKEKFKTSLEALDAERTALVKTTIENLKPGTPFDHAALRDIQRVETRKNRLIVGRFAALLKKNEPGIVPIVHQILDI